MRGRFMIVVLAVLFSLPVGAVFAIDFFNDSFTPLYADIIIEWTNNTHYTYKFQVGEVVNFTIFFFYKENPIDPEAMNLTLSIYEPYSFDVKEYPLNATRISKGRYRGNFTILEDWDGKQGGVNVNFTYGGYLAGAESDIFDIGEVVVEELTLQLTSNISMIDMVSPGDTVTLYLKALRGDELVDLDLRYLNTMVSVDTGNFNVDYTLPGNFPLNRVGKGIYTLTVTVPDNIPCYGKFDVLVMYSDPFHDDFSFAYYIFKADPFPVWVNLIDKGGESYTVDVYVYDSNGMTLSGATVETLTEEGDKISSTTDSVGRARLTIPFQGEEVPSSLPLKITYGGISQYGSVYYHWMTKEYEAPYFEDFEVLATEYQSNLDPWVVILPPGEHTVNFTAYYNYEAYTKPIIAYIRNETTVVAYNLTPDSAGHFTMNFTVANGSYLFATFRAEMENGGWNETYLHIIGSNESEKRITLRDLISDEVEVSHTGLYPGGEIEFNINYTGEMSDEMAVLFDMYLGEVKLDESPAIWWTPSFNNFTYLYPGAVHVQRSSLRSPETRVKLKMPLLPPDLRGRNVTFIWGYIPSLDIGTLVDKLFGSYMGDIFISADLFLTEFLKNFKLQVVTIPWEEGEGILSARVTNETGSPVAGATVTVGNATVKTDDDGSFSLHLPVGVYHITISAEGYVPWEGSVAVLAGRTTDINITLKEIPEVWANLTVNVFDPDGKPVDAEVELMEIGEAVGEGGVYRFVYIPCGTYHLKVTAENYREYSQVVSLRPNSTTVVNVTLELIPLTPWGHLRVLVSDESGNGIEGAEVRIVNGDFNSSSLTNSDGMALFMYVPTGNYNITVSAEGYITASAQGRVERWNPTDVEVRLTRARAEVYGGGVKEVDGEYEFYIYYRDSGGRAPQGMYIVVDGEEHTMSGEGENYTGGVRFSVKLKLVEGEHKYYFRCLAPGGEEITPTDSTPHSEASAGTLEVKGGGGGEKLPVYLLAVIALVVVVAVAAVILVGRKGGEGPEE